MKHLHLIIICLLTFLSVEVRAQYYSVNIDTKTVAAMAGAYATETATEAYYNEQVQEILKHYRSAEVAAAGIFSSKYLDRKAMTDLGLWSSSTENYYYRRIYNLVSARIMPKIWTVAGMMMKSPQNAIYWGSYLLKICEETKSLCMQFESVVTNSRLSFSDIAFLSIKEDIAAILRLSELGNVDWKNVLDSFSNVTENFTKEKLKEDIDNLYKMGVGLASAGAGNLVNSILQGSTFNGTLDSKIGAAITVAGNAYDLYKNLDSNLGNTLLGMVGGKDGVANLFEFSNYNMTSWATDYASEAMGKYYTQRWYIYRRDYGSETLCNYSPPTDDNSIINGDHWYRISTSDASFSPNSTQKEQILQNSESHAGWSRAKVKQLNNAKDGYTYTFSNYLSAYIISKKGKQTKKAYAYHIIVTKSWDNTDVVYEDIFDSYTMDLSTFKAQMQVKLQEYNDNEEGKVYYLASDNKKYYQTTDAAKLKGVETVTISVTCHDGATLGQGTTQYKCSSCGSSVNAHTKQCAMLTTITDRSLDTSELDAQIQEQESKVASLASQIATLEAENASLIKKISTSSIEDAAKYREQYNANKTKIDQLKAEKTNAETQLQKLKDAKTEAAESETTQTDDYNRIPAIMQNCKTAYNLTWNGEGSWNGNTYVRTATMPNINGTITFKATVSISRKPKYFLGIKIHRAIVQISWELTTEYSDTQVVDVLNLDPNKSDEEKTKEVNQRIAEVARDYPDCEVSTQYAKSAPAQTDDTGDTFHLLWSSDRLEIAREVDSRLTKIYADLISLEKMMSYKYNILDMLMNYVPLDTEQGRRGTIIEQCRRRWLRHAARSSHSTSYSGQYDDEEETE